MKCLYGFILLPIVSCVMAGTAPATDPETVLERFSEASRGQGARLRGASMDVEIEARLPKLRKWGHLRALRRISRIGRISYEALHFDGDNTIKSGVIVRYLAADAQAAMGDGGSLAVTPANYKFRYRGSQSWNGRDLYVFQVTPRKKRVGLFKGELWLDAETCLPVRQTGRLVKNPSVFLRRVDFVQEYEIREGVAIPRQIDSVVDTRLVGKAELTIHFSNVSLVENAASLAGASSSE